MIEKAAELLQLIIEVKHLAHQTRTSFATALRRVLACGLESSYLEEYQVEEHERLEMDWGSHINP